MFDQNLEFKNEVFMIFFSIRCDDVDVIICYLFTLFIEIINNALNFECPHLAESDVVHMYMF